MLRATTQASATRAPLPDWLRGGDSVFVADSVDQSAGQLLASPSVSQQSAAGERVRLEGSQFFRVEWSSRTRQSDSVALDTEGKQRAASVRVCVKECVCMCVRGHTQPGLFLHRTGDLIDFFLRRTGYW